MTPTHSIKYALLLLIFVSTINCLRERDTTLTIEGDNPPTFRMAGSGLLSTLRVGGPKKQRDGVGEDPYLYWVIKFKQDGSERPIESIGTIVYGEIPSGYIQVFPDPDQSPPILSEDELYDLNVVTMNANGARLKFAIHEGKAVSNPVVRDGKLVLQ